MKKKTYSTGNIDLAAMLAIGFKHADSDLKATANEKPGGVPDFLKDLKPCRLLCVDPSENAQQKVFGLFVFDVPLNFDAAEFEQAAKNKKLIGSLQEFANRKRTFREKVKTLFGDGETKALGR